MAGLGKGIQALLVGKTFGHLIVVSAAPPRKSTKSSKTYVAWECLCDCGNSITLTGKQLTRGQVSCGCARFSGRFRKQLTDIDANVMKVISEYSNKAKAKNRIWLLSFDEAKTLLLSSCKYCGSSPSRLVRVYPDIESTLVGGIDRVDSSLGYTVENVVPCCKICNRAKSDLTYSDFMSWIALISTNIKALHD